MIDTPAGMFHTKVNREIISVFCYIRNDWTDLKLNLVAGLHYEKNDMGGACTTYGEEERCIQGSSGET